MKKTLILLVIFGCSACTSTLTEDERVTRVLKQTPLIDGHNDMPGRYRSRVRNQLEKLDLSADLTLLDQPTHTDIPRLRKGMVGGQFWSVYVSISEYGGKPVDVQRVLEQIDLVHRMVAKHSGDLEIAYTADDVRRIHANGKIASLIGMEGGHAINNSLAVLRSMYQLGARYMTLTHSKGLRWVDSATDDDRHGGLTAFGEAVIREMNRVGMLVDLSHVSVATMRDALATSAAPVIFSHSSAYKVVPHARNVPDDVLELVAANNGVVMVTFYPSYVSEATRVYGIQFRAESNRLNSIYDEAEVAKRLQIWRADNPAPRPTLEQVADHIDHIRSVAGIDAIGIGGDYDGMPPGPVGLEDVSTYPALLAELLRRGYSDSDIAKIAGGNVLRVLESAERVARKLAKDSPAEVHIDELDGGERPTDV
jgi:membrane dipeptidase